MYEKYKNKLPQGWVECQLGEVFNIVNGDRGKNYPAKNKLHASGIPFVSAINIQNSKLFIENLLYLNEQQYDLLRSGKINKGDTLLCIRGSIGKHCIYPFNKGAIASSMVIIRKILPNIDKFLFYYLESFYFRQEVKKYDNGTAQPNLSASDLKRFNYLLPPLNEQKRIVEKIESEFEKIDEGLEHLLKTKEQIKQYRQSVLKSAFEGKLYKNSEWKSIELKNFCLQVNKRKISNNEQEEFFYIDISSIDNKNNILLSATKYNGKNAPSRARQIVKSGDILFSTVRTYLKNIAMVPSEYDNQIASTGFCVIRTNSNLLYSKFMFYKSLSDNFLEPLNQLQRGSSYPAVRDNDVLSQIVCIPLSIEEQKKIVEEIEKRFAVADEVEKLVEDSIEKGEQLKQSILKKAFEGRLVPQDPTDEPASKLLEKIKQERNIKWQKII